VTEPAFCEQRGEQVLHQAGHDAGECRADDDADRQIDHVAAQDKGLELADPAGLSKNADGGLHAAAP